MQPQSPQQPQLHPFLTQKQPLRRNNVTLVQMNKSKIKFLNKYLSRSEMGTYSTASVSSTQQTVAPTDEYNLQFRMKEKFQELYKRIQRISKNMSPDEIRGKIQKRFIVAPNDEITKIKQIPKNVNKLQQELIKLGYRSKATRNLRAQSQTQHVKLQINNLSPQQKDQQITNFRVLGNTRYRHRLISVVKPTKMSNNIKDYLSVQKIRLKDLQDSIVQKQHNIITKNTKLRVSLYNDLTESLSTQIVGTTTALPAIATTEKNEDAKVMMNATVMKYPVSKSKKFQAPFETYYYRDLVWRVGYSNEKIVEFPAEYESKIKVFIGKGNNSRLVKSIIARRSWYQVTEKIQQAHFVWTQIKVQSVFASQIAVKSALEPSRYNIQQNSTPYINDSIWTHHEQKVFKKYFEAHRHSQSKINQSLRFRNRVIPKPWQKHAPKQKQTIPLKSVLQISCSMPTIGPTQHTASTTSLNFNTNPKIKLHNHFINSYLIGNKKALFQTMSDYYARKGDDVFKYLPLTFHISNGLDDEKYLKFLNIYYANSKKSLEQQDRNSKFNAWIVKPGENTNRGQGITVCLNLQSIKAILKKKDKHNDGSNKTYIVQKYIQRPMLYKRRKFDLRHYIMINCSNGHVKGYWFREGYVRTTSSEYTLKQGLGSVHLTNDAVQKNLPDYGKYEKGNKISYEELDGYLGRQNQKWSFWQQAYPKMKKIATDVICASALSLDPDRRTNFEIYGLDFMIDETMKVYLIEVNTNPCLQLSCPLLAKIIPKMIEQTLEICLDPHNPPPTTFNPKGTTLKKNCLQQIEYQLVYDDRFQENSSTTENILLNDESLKKEEDDCFQDDGQDWNQD